MSLRAVDVTRVREWLETMTVAARREIPALKFAMKINGLDLLNALQEQGRGLWINPLNDACTVRFSEDMIRQLIEEATGKD